MVSRKQFATPLGEDGKLGSFSYSRSTTPTTQGSRSRASTPMTVSSATCSDLFLAEVDDEFDIASRNGSKASSREGARNQSQSLTKRALAGLPESKPGWAAEGELASSVSSIVNYAMKTLAGAPSRALLHKKRGCASTPSLSSKVEHDDVVLVRHICDTLAKDEHELAHAFRAYATCVSGKSMKWKGFERLAKHSLFFDSKLSMAEGHCLFTRLLAEGKKGLDFEQFKELLRYVAFERDEKVKDVHRAVEYCMDVGMQHRQRSRLPTPSHVRRVGSVGHHGHW